ncbi:MAG: hypothetical protein ACKVS8_02725 [Phycisphaerales bacterium]
MPAHLWPLRHFPQASAAFARHFVVIAALALASEQALVHHRRVDLHTLPQPAPVLGGADVPSASSRATEERGPANSSVSSTSPLLAALLNPSLSLLDIAAAHNLTLDQLTALIVRPDIAEQLAALHSAAALRVRIVAAHHLPNAVEALAAIIATDTTADTFPTLDRTNFRHMVFRQRRTETVRRAASTILRLANFHPPARAAASRATEERGPASSSVPFNAPPSSPSAPLHREAVEVSSRGSPRSGTPGNDAPQSPSSHAGLNAPCANAPARATSVPINAPPLRAASARERSSSGPANSQPLTPRPSLASRLLAACGAARSSGDP